MMEADARRHDGSTNEEVDEADEMQNKDERKDLPRRTADMASGSTDSCHP